MKEKNDEKKYPGIWTAANKRQLKSYSDGFRAGKLSVKKTAEQKRADRKSEIEREVRRELTEKLKEIFGFATQSDIREAIEGHENGYWHNDER